MGEIMELLAQAFSGCVVQNGQLVFQNNYSYSDLARIQREFVGDLLGRRIPHYRVIGFYHGWDDQHAHSVFRCNDIFGISLIELSAAMQYVIPADIGGNNPEAGCFYGVNEEVVNKSEFDEAYGISKSMRAGSKKANILMLPSTEIGSLMVDYQVGPDLDEVEEINTSRMWYTQFSIVEPVTYPQMLIPNKRLCSLVKEGMGDPVTFMFIKKGTGSYEYSEVQKFFNDSVGRIMPCPVDYDLSKFFTCCAPTADGNSLRLCYLEQLDESVLTRILQDYGRSMSI